MLLHVRHYPTSDYLPSTCEIDYYNEPTRSYPCIISGSRQTQAVIHNQNVYVSEGSVVHQFTFFFSRTMSNFLLTSSSPTLSGVATLLSCTALAQTLCGLSTSVLTICNVLILSLRSKLFPHVAYYLSISSLPQADTLYRFVTTLNQWSSIKQGDHVFFRHVPASSAVSLRRSTHHRTPRCCSL